MTDGIRQPNALSPNTRIDAAMRTFPRGGCSEFGSSPAGAPAYGAPSGTAMCRIVRAALT